MARTPLLHALQQLAGEHAEATEKGISVEKVRRQRGTVISRRDLLTGEQSSLNLVYLLGFQPSSGSFSIFGSSDERFHIIGGNQRLPEAIAASFPAGSIKFRWRLTTIAKNQGGPRG